MNIMLTDMQKNFNTIMKTNFNIKKYFSSLLKNYYSYNIKDGNSYNVSNEYFHYIDDYIIGRMLYFNYSRCYNNHQDGSIWIYKFSEYLTDYKNMYNKLYIDSINFITFFYDSLKKKLYTDLNIDSNLYDIKLYKTYNTYNTYISDSTIINPLLIDHKYEPCIAFFYSEHNLFCINRGRILLQDYIFNCDGERIKYRTIILPLSNKIIFNSINTNKNFLSFKEKYKNDDTIKINSAYTKLKSYVEVISNIYIKDENNNNRLREDIVDVGIPLPLQSNFYGEYNIFPTRICFINIVSNLSIGVIDKSNNKFVMILDSNNNGNLKVVNECTGFNEVISFKKNLNYNVSKRISKEDKNKYDALNADIESLTNDRDTLINNSRDRINNYIILPIMKKRFMKLFNIKEINKDNMLINSYVRLNRSSLTKDTIESYTELFLSLDAFNIYKILSKYYPDVKTFKDKNVKYSIFNVHFNKLDDNEFNVFLTKRLFNYLFNCKGVAIDNNAYERLNYINKFLVDFHSMINISNPDNEVLYKNNKLGRFVKYINALCRYIKNKVVYYLHNDFEIDKLENYNKAIIQKRYERDKLYKNYKLTSTKFKRSMRDIKDIDNYDDIIIEANYFIGNGLQLNYIELM